MLTHVSNKSKQNVFLFACSEQNNLPNEVVMSRWDDTAKAIWDGILEWVKARRADGWTTQKIADRVGVGSRSVITDWIKGNRKAQNAPFSVLLDYLDNTGMDYRDFFPKDDRLLNQGQEGFSHECEQLKERVRELEELLERTRHQRDLAMGEIRALEKQVERLAPGPKEKAFSQSNTSTHGLSSKAV